MTKKITSNDSTYDTDIALINQNVLTIKNDVQEIKDKLEKKYVSKEELELEKQKIRNLEKLVYGLVALILIAVVGALLKLVVFT